MRNKLLFLTVIGVFFNLVFSCKQEKKQDVVEVAQKPNVLFITVDDMNGWGVKNQYPLVKMPYFDKLKSESFNFTKTICPSPVCVPSRAAFFSGVAPHRSGAYYNGCDPWQRSEILKTVETMPECFKRNGYTTFGRGKIFHAQMTEGREEAMFDNRPIYKGGFGPFGIDGGFGEVFGGVLYAPYLDWINSFIDDGTDPNPVSTPATLSVLSLGLGLLLVRRRRSK